MIPVSAFVDKVKEIAARPLTYRTGGKGDDGTCDCIGLIIGAMHELGHVKYDMHSTNYFTRYQMVNLEPVERIDLRPGMLVYKGRYGSDLNARYQQGGRYYTGDLTDYYHVGVVESAFPLVIVHCTEGNGVNGITRDEMLGNWAYAGMLKNVAYEEFKESEVSPMQQKAIVFAENGDDVNVRKRPNIKGQLVMRVPVQSVVTIIETAKNNADEKWSRIEYGGYTGYMMTQYLKPLESDEEPKETPSDVEEEVIIALPKSTAESLLRALVEVLQS